MKRILKSRNIKNKNELLQAINEIWDSFPQESINKLVASFKVRLQMVLEHDGKSITDIHRSGIHKAPTIDVFRNENTMDLAEMITTIDPTVDDSPIEVKTRCKWELEEDIILLTSVKKLGSKLSSIAERLDDRTANSCRKRGLIFRAIFFAKGYFFHNFFN